MIQISPADLHDPELIGFLEAHLADLAPISPPESQHALDVEALRKPEVRMWAAYAEGELVGTVALAELHDGHEELKSMRTSPAQRGKGIGKQLVSHALADARSRGVSRVSLETGSETFFAPARALYLGVGFAGCDPFGSYVEDPNSVYMTIEL